MADFSIVYIIGQIFGVIAVILGFISYQMKTSKTVLILQISVCAVFTLHYLLIGAMSGFALNALCLIRNIVYFFRGRGLPKNRIIPAVFTAVMCAVGVFSWQGFPSVFIIVGMAVNTVGMSFSDPNNIKKSILISSPLVIIYDVLVSSYGGILYEAVVITSSAIGLLRYYLKTKRG